MGLLSRLLGRGAKTAKSGADDAAEGAARANSAWANASSSAFKTTAAIGGGAWSLGQVSDAYEQKKMSEEAQAYLQQQENVMNDPSLSEDQKAAILANMDRGGDEGGIMAFLDSLSMTQAAMIIALGYLGLRGIAILGGVR